MHSIYICTSCIYGKTRIFCRLRTRSNANQGSEDPHKLNVWFARTRPAVTGRLLEGRKTHEKIIVQLLQSPHNRSQQSSSAPNCPMLFWEYPNLLGHSLAEPGDHQGVTGQEARSRTKCENGCFEKLGPKPLVSLARPIQSLGHMSLNAKSV